MIAVELARALVKAKREAGARRRARARARSGRITRRCGSRRAKCCREPAPDDARERVSPRDRAGASRRARRTSGSRASQPAHARAERTLRALVEKVPTRSRVTIGSRSGSRRERSAARRSCELRAVLEREPDHLDARLDLARTLRRMGKLDEAIAQTRSAFDRAGQPMDIAEELFWLLCEADDRQAAIDLLTLLDDDRSDADALAAVARLQRGLGRLDRGARRRRADRALDADAGAIALAEAEIVAGDFDRGDRRRVSAIRDDPPRASSSRAASRSTRYLAATSPAKRARGARSRCAPRTPTSSTSRCRRRSRSPTPARGSDARAAAGRAAAGQARRDRWSLARAARRALGDPRRRARRLERSSRAQARSRRSRSTSPATCSPTRKQRLADAERYLPTPATCRPATRRSSTAGAGSCSAGKPREAVAPSTAPPVRAPRARDPAPPGDGVGRRRGAAGRRRAPRSRRPDYDPSPSVKRRIDCRSTLSKRR